MGRVVKFSAAVLVVVLLMDSAIVTSVVGKSIADVNIFNLLGEPLRLWCKSRDDDLGDKTIQDGQYFGWGFTPNIWGTTLFYCHFGWGAKRQALTVFDASGAEAKCKHCLYQVRRDGFYVTTEGGPQPFKFVAGWN